ncbi:MAG: hypothetical protein RRC34_02905 [Lentisphaeria bacterium]|nr:hypothetical protein [Lentisphaeria bacterium]
MLTREQLMAAAKPRIETVKVPGLGEVGVRIMPGSAREKFESFCISKQDKNGNMKDVNGVKPKLLALTLVDADGKLMFDDSPRDRDVINSLPSNIIEPLFAKADAMNRTGAKGAEDAEKN